MACSVYVPLPAGRGIDCMWSVQVFWYGPSIGNGRHTVYGSYHQYRHMGRQMKSKWNHGG
jgi:hypothetical protein